SEIIHFHNYPSEEYHVETEDGYILTINRIPHGSISSHFTAARPVVFLLHGVVGDGSHWISNQPHNSFGFILADNGYDVWLGNSRGNTWSSNHKILKPWQKEFWSFSFHEMGYYDIPAAIYFILNQTKQQQLYYVGHSEGTTAGFISFSTWPELAEKIKIHNKKGFQAYDYGTKEKNMEKYNQIIPPVYKIEDIKIPIALWSGGNDLFVNIRDVEALISRLSNVIYHQHVPEWQHLDYIWGLDATEIMYMRIIEIMKSYA
ncbi:Lipase, partial [Crotalus adamanteus]